MSVNLFGTILCVCLLVRVYLYTDGKLLADDYMKRMGFSDTHLRAYVLHDDKDGQHIHIVASRIDATSGKLYLGKNENLTSTRIIQILNKTTS